MPHQEDSRPIPPTTMVFDGTSETSSFSVAKWGPATVATHAASASTHISESVGNTVNGVIRDAQAMIKARYSCSLANPAESPVCVITIKPKYSESVRAALEKDEIGFYTKASYNSSTCEMIFHFLPSHVHSAAACEFMKMLTTHLDLLPMNQQYRLRDNATIRVPNGFKEPDAQIFLTGRGPKDPTLVLEVGYSEGMSDLRLDARRWLSRTPPVLLVVLIDIKKPHTTGMPTVTVEHWRRTERRPYGEFIYSEVWPYTDNQDYRIRLDYIFDTIPPQFITDGVPHDLVIPDAFVDRFMSDIRVGWLAML
ncbi:hypothetical protein PILCRDRAFT_816751 [Piloderma croceum F 1598]|uniref:Restriction endonuclease domain-containing protein n=1 Tax=Piloderma croceum (strain F 1598) TaxID=765440 RepID=A0A0C3C795_PILCF|nr:hypothetical protein PILCRDRAFT_816751 [Piloderma croceum F 1598]